jgi:hypothetical protein
MLRNALITTALLAAAPVLAEDKQACAPRGDRVEIKSRRRRSRLEIP